MAGNGLSTGIDHKLTFIDINGIHQFVILEDFTAKEDAVVGKEISIDGTVRHPKFHEGWSGSFTLQRSNNVMDNYFAIQEASYYQGVDQLPMMINETIKEIDGSLSEYQYTDVVLVFEDAGNWTGTTIAKQRVSFMASRRQELV